jgi:hypothetical protein
MKSRIPQARWKIAKRRSFLVADVLEQKGITKYLNNHSCTTLLLFSVLSVVLCFQAIKDVAHNKILDHWDVAKEIYSPLLHRVDHHRRDKNLA